MELADIPTGCTNTGTGRHTHRVYQHWNWQSYPQGVPTLELADIPTGCTNTGTGRQTHRVYQHWNWQTDAD